MHNCWGQAAGAVAAAAAVQGLAGVQPSCHLWQEGSCSSSSSRHRIVCCWAAASHLISGVRRMRYSWVSTSSTGWQVGLGLLSWIGWGPAEMLCLADWGSKLLWLQQQLGLPAWKLQLGVAGLCRVHAGRLGCCYWRKRRAGNRVTSWMGVQG